MSPSVMFLITTLLPLLLALPSAAAQVQLEIYDPDCQPLHRAGKHGPFDYRAATVDEKVLVEGAHFDIHYQGYKLGKTKIKTGRSVIETPAAGFGYTLWAFPNHHLALTAIEDLGYRWKADRLPELPLRVHCYFKRAVKFVPDDGLVRALYGYYYARRGKAVDAKNHLVEALRLQPDGLNVLVYVANAYLELNQLDLAAEYARRAYAAGYPLPGLRQRIEKTGRSLN